jgi:HSP20 family protein
MGLATAFLWAWPCYDSSVAFARWDPLRDLLAIQQRLDRFAPAPAGWQPPVDLYETTDAYVVTAELPGVEQGDVEIQTGDGRLTLSGSRREHRVACEQYHRLERGHGAFQRSFQLPLPIDSDKITAELKDGVLTIRCPKTAGAAARRITITP